MDDVTDVVFRQIIAELARPNVFFTEFVNVEAINSEGRDKQIGRLKFTKDQHPIVAQIWGLKPENFLKTATLVQKLGFDGVDINMGCPEKTVLKSGSGAALINNQDLASEIIRATKEGAPKIPVSVKSRIGVKKIQTEEWFSFLLNQDLAAITVHGRTASEMSKVPCHWDEIAKVVKMRNNLERSLRSLPISEAEIVGPPLVGGRTIIIGNGDVNNYADAIEKSKIYGVDGVMIGRGIFTDPAAFSPSAITLSPEQRLDLLAKHTKLFGKTWGQTKNFAIMKKFFKIYCQGFPGAAELRAKLMETKSEEQVIKTLLFAREQTRTGCS